MCNRRAWLPRFASRIGFKGTPSGRQMEVNIMNAKEFIYGAGCCTDGQCDRRVWIRRWRHSEKVCADGSYPPCNTEGETATNNLSVPLWVTSDGSVVSTPAAPPAAQPRLPHS